jgi:acyl carrier protein
METERLSLVLSLASDVIRRPVEATDNFFDLGGDSITAVEFSTRVEETLGTEVDIVLLFEADTFSEYSRLLGDL